MIFSMFFFFRDGDILLRELKTLIPMAPKYKDMVVNKLREVTYATFFGIFGTGICQGVAAGLIFWGLGISNPTLWAAATALVSLIPVIGTATIWVPLSIYQILGYPFNRTRPGSPQFSRGASQEGAPGPVGARALAAAWTALPGAAWWR